MLTALDADLTRKEQEVAQIEKYIQDEIKALDDAKVITCCSFRLVSLLRVLLCPPFVAFFCNSTTVRCHVFAAR